jgi:hypothetical protein
MWERTDKEKELTTCKLDDLAHWQPFKHDDFPDCVLFPVYWTNNHVVICLVISKDGRIERVNFGGSREVTPLRGEYNVSFSIKDSYYS